MGRAWLSCGRRSTQSLPDQLRRACFRVAGAVLSEPGSADFVGGAVHRASRTSCGTRGHRLAAGGFRVTGAVLSEPRSADFVAGAVHRAFRRSCGTPSALLYPPRLRPVL